MMPPSRRAVRRPSSSGSSASRGTGSEGECVKSDDRAAERGFALNGLSVHSLRLNQEGELQVEFDLPGEQTTPRWHTQVRGVRTLNVYDDAELQEACKRLFQIVRRRVMEPDPDRVKVHCDRCAT